MPEAAAKKATPRKKAVTVKKSETALFDLDAAVAEVAEPQEMKPFEFTYGGSTWSMRPVIESDAKLMANIDLTEIQQVMSYIRDLLDDEQWERFPRISYQAAMLLIEQYSDFTMGEALGESKAPTDS